MKIEIKTPNWEPKLAHLRALVPTYINPARQVATIVVTQSIQRDMQQPGTPPQYPIQWDSAKQRAAFFATDGFGGGIPHKRTGEYQDSWKIEALENSVRLFSNSGATPFVGGNAFGLVRSGIHKGRWQLTQDALIKGFEKLPAAHIEATKQAILDFYADQ